MRFALLASLSLAGLVACGGSSTPANTANNNAQISGDPDAVKQARQMHECGKDDQVHHYDLHDEDGDRALVPCSKSGQNDY